MHQTIFKTIIFVSALSLLNSCQDQSGGAADEFAQVVNRQQQLLNNSSLDEQQLLLALKKFPEETLALKEFRLQQQALLKRAQLIQVSIDAGHEVALEQFQSLEIGLRQRSELQELKQILLVASELQELRQQLSQSKAREGLDLLKDFMNKYEATCLAHASFRDWHDATLAGMKADLGLIEDKQALLLLQHLDRHRAAGDAAAALGAQLSHLHFSSERNNIPAIEEAWRQQIDMPVFKRSVGKASGLSDILASTWQQADQMPLPQLLQILSLLDQNFQPDRRLRIAILKKALASRGFHKKALSSRPLLDVPALLELMQAPAASEQR